MNNFLFSLGGMFRNFPLMGGTGASLNAVLTPTHIWLIVGLALCSMELALPTAFVSFMMGLSAIVVSILALVIPSVKVQLFAWLVLSTASVILSRRWLTPKKKSYRLNDDHEGKTLTDIPAGQAGRVFYEGNSWRAICAEENLAIAANQTVYVIKQKGTTLIVLPKDMSLLTSQH